MWEIKPYQLILLGMLVWMPFSCKKEALPEEEIGSPEFYLIGNLGGEDFHIQAGKEGYFMETFYEIDQQSIYSFGGAFQLQGQESQAQPGTMRFLIRSNKDYSGNIDNSLAPGSYPFRRPAVTDTSYAVQFNPVLYTILDSNDVTYAWNFGDSSVSTAKNPLHIYTNQHIGKYRVSLSAEFSGSCSSTLRTDVFMPSAPCTASFTYDFNGHPRDLNFYGASTGSEPFRYEWNFNTTEKQAFSKDVHYYYHATPPIGVENTCLKVIDANNCVSEVCSNVVIDSADCAINFTYLVNTLSQKDSSDYSTVTIEYLSPQGRLYTSKHANQPSVNIFDIRMQKAYQRDRHGNKTRWVEFTASCRLYSGQDSLQLQIERGVIAVAYP